MADPKNLFTFAFRFEARDHQRVDAWLRVGDDLVLGPLHLTKEQSQQMGCLMEQAVTAMAEASDVVPRTRTRTIRARLRANEPLEVRSEFGTRSPYDSLPDQPAECSTGTDARRIGRGRRR